MHRIYLRSRFVTNQFFCRQLSVSVVGNSKWNPVLHERHADLGRHVYETFTVSALIKQYPHWNAARLDGFVQGTLCFYIHQVLIVEFLVYIFP